MTKPLPAALHLLRLFAVALSLAAANALPALPPALRVDGTRLVTAADGQPVRLRGVNCASLEWSADGEGHIAKSVEVAVTQWHANLIRLPLSQDRWFGHAPEQQDHGVSYRALVKQIVDFCAAHDAYIILDLHWSNAGEWGKHIGQHKLPDINSVVFWEDAAQAYANHPAVLFDLYNEPWGVTWEQWRKGGLIVESDKKAKTKLTYQAVGLQTLLDAIRATGAKNVIVASGGNWAYEFEGIPGAHELSDPTGQGVIYGAHPYPHSYARLGQETLAQWTARMEKFAAKLPLIVTEFGSDEKMWKLPKDWNSSDEQWNRGMIAVLEAHAWSWTAWDFHPAASPSTIADFACTPTPQFGIPVKEALAKNRRNP